jgi:hypothetical protein
MADETRPQENSQPAIITEYLTNVLSPNFRQIAPKLRSGNHFVLWNPELREDQTIQKPLYRAKPALYHGSKYPASTTKPESWASFEQARRAYLQGGYAGIGRVFSQDEQIADQPTGSHFIFLDFDHCILDRATRTPNPAVREILDELRSYGEVSPSGDGAHANIICNTLPPGLKNVYHYRDQKIEVYWSERYSTLTGHRIPNTLPDVEERTNAFHSLVERWSAWEEENTGVVCVCDRALPIGDDPPSATPSPAQLVVEQQVDQAQQQRRSRRAGALPNSQDQGEPAADPPHRPTLEELSDADQAVYACACAARNGQNFMTLWSGGDPRNRRKNNGEPDPSQADFDLALQLLYWTHDNIEQTERLFRASQRYRAGKTDRITDRDGRTYLQHTIQNALDKRPKVRQQPRPPATPTHPQAMNFPRQAASLSPEDPDLPTMPGGAGR